MPWRRHESPRVGLQAQLRSLTDRALPVSLAGGALVTALGLLRGTPAAAGGRQRRRGRGGGGSRGAAAGRDARAAGLGTQADEVGRLVRRPAFGRGTGPRRRGLLRQDGHAEREPTAGRTRRPGRRGAPTRGRARVRAAGTPSTTDGQRTGTPPTPPSPTLPRTGQRRSRDRTQSPAVPLRTAVLRLAVRHTLIGQGRTGGGARRRAPASTRTRSTTPCSARWPPTGCGCIAVARRDRHAPRRRARRPTTPTRSTSCAAVGCNSLGLLGLADTPRPEARRPAAGTGRAAASGSG